MSTDLSSAKSREYRLVKRPVGRVKPTDFEYVESPVPEPGPGQALARTLYLSLDPANRLWMNEGESYRGPIPLGQVMEGLGLAQIVRSNNPAFPVGSLVTGLVNWRDYNLLGEGVRALFMPVPPSLKVPPEDILSLFGMTSQTAYFGLFDIGRPQLGETVVVSAAAGATGSMVIQLAKAHGCRAVGIAGSDEKCAWLLELGADAAVNYKSPDFRAQLAAATPSGIDVLFENVGGDVMDECFGRLNLRARVALCGLISGYNERSAPPGPRNFGRVLMKRVRIEGFIILDYASRFPEATAKLYELWREGRLKHRTTIVDGLENASTVINQLFDGANVGKLLIKVADPPLPLQS